MDRNRFSSKRINGLALPLPRDPAFEAFHRETARARLVAGISSVVANVNNLFIADVRDTVVALFTAKSQYLERNHGALFIPYV